MKKPRNNRSYIVVAIIALAVISFFVPRYASEKVRTVSFITAVEDSRTEYFQGDTVIIDLPKDTVAVQSGTFNGENISFFPWKESFRAIFAIPVDLKPGEYLATIKYNDSKTIEKIIVVMTTNFKTVSLGVPAKLNLTENQVVERIQTGSHSLNEAMAVQSPNIYFNDGFQFPVEITEGFENDFGEIRKTGESLVRHLGTDFPGEPGDPVFSLNDGKVRAAFSSSIYGNTVIIDHGQGIYSLYLHLDQIKTEAGKIVRKGEEIGTLGNTGYSTGAHLHLSLKVNSVSVDPVKFIQDF